MILFTNKSLKQVGMGSEKSQSSNIMGIKSIIKRFLLKRKKAIIIDKLSEINYNVINKTINAEYPCLISDSICSFEVVNEGCRISDSKCYGDIILGRFVSISGPGTVIKALKEKIYIGSFCSIGQNVCIVDFNHLYNRITSSFIHYQVFNEDYKIDIDTKGQVVLEEDVWIGSNTIILPGVKIGRGSVIGGGSVVTKDIPRYSIALGNPAKVVSTRFDENTIQLLEELQWWEWDIAKIKRNKKLFSISLAYNTSEQIKAIID